ncbi:hypothetical protein HAX54_008493 [Datura stramonium]|uniref:Uncharacterized protein n=1 Tax=Datura stramonium TaxID=4076 RepID=A0ABS8WV82_DATST|nr:hypothetical protein [Datura stramonium]
MAHNRLSRQAIGSISCVARKQIAHISRNEVPSSWRYTPKCSSSMHAMIGTPTSLFHVLWHVRHDTGDAKMEGVTRKEAQGTFILAIYHATREQHGHDGWRVVALFHARWHVRRGTGDATMEGATRKDVSHGKKMDLLLQLGKGTSSPK